MVPDKILSVENLCKTFDDTGMRVEILKGIDLEISRGDLVGIVGASGAGKSTLLHLIAGLETPSSGEVCFRGENIFEWGEARRSAWRATQIGFIFQFYHLLPELSALENTLLPGLLVDLSRKETMRRANEILCAFGLEARASHKPAQLSGGESQRVAIARACFLKPPLLLADEPTGNLDQTTGGKILAHLLQIQKEMGSAIVLVTHNHALLEGFNRVYEIRNGHLSTL